MKARFTYWKENDGCYLGYLNDYPDHWIQGASLDDLKDHLKRNDYGERPATMCI